MLTTFEQDDYIFGALSAGASGFLLKRTKPEELIAAIHTIAAGDSLLSPSVTRKRDRAHGGPARARSPPPRARSTELTPREREVLELIGRGLSNTRDRGRVRDRGVDGQDPRRRVLLKLGLRDRVQAVIFAYESGLTKPGSPG